MERHDRTEELMELAALFTLLPSTPVFWPAQRNTSVHQLPLPLILRTIELSGTGFHYACRSSLWGAHWHDSSCPYPFMDRANTNT